MSDEELALFGRNLFGDAIRPKATGPVAERFKFAPFTLLDARSGEWQDRKRAWAAMGIQSELGRGEVGPDAAPGGSAMPAMDYSKGERGDGAGRPIKKAMGQDFHLGAQPTHGGRGKTWDTAAGGSAPQRRALLGGGAGNSAEQAADLAARYGLDEAALANGGQGVYTSATSIFDPVLCELAYRWFCEPGGQVLDPFAGGSVRGIVAGALGRRYWGSDLREEQIAANRKQADEIDPKVKPEWVCGDSRYTMESAPEADLLFTCPPYGDLERYSDDEADISTYGWTGFSIAYRLILRRAAERLRRNRFAVIVVGNYRDKSGLYCDLVGETVAAMAEAGLGYYNEAVLATAVGSASIRVTKQFTSGRKLCKVHQNVLVFLKGEAKAAASRIKDETP